MSALVQPHGEGRAPPGGLPAGPPAPVHTQGAALDLHLPAPAGPWPGVLPAFEEGSGGGTGGARDGGTRPSLGTLTLSEKERALMAMPKLWAFVLCAPRRCSMSDTVPMMRTITGSPLWKKPSRKGGSSPRSRRPWGRWGQWAVGPLPLHTPRTPALPGRPRANTDSALPRPSSRPGHLHCSLRPAGSRPGSAHEGNELRALVCPLGAVDRLRTGFSSLSHWGSSWG